MKKLIYILLIIFAYSCKKENIYPTKYCMEGSIFSYPGIITEINTSSGSYNTVDYIKVASDTNNLRLLHADTLIYRNITGGMYQTMQVGDSIVRCQF